MQHFAYLLGFGIQVSFLYFSLFFFFSLSKSPKPNWNVSGNMNSIKKKKSRSMILLVNHSNASGPNIHLLFFHPWNCSQRLLNLHKDSWVSRSKVCGIQVYYDSHLLSSLLCSPYPLPFKFLPFVSYLEKKQG